MKKTIFVLAGLAVLLLAWIIGWPKLEQTQPLSATPSPETEQAITQSLSQLPLYFIENQGQLDEQVAYYVRGSETTVYFTATGVTIAQTTPAKPPLTPLSFRGVFDEESLLTSSERFLAPQTVLGVTENAEAQRWSVKLEFVGANPDVQPIGKGQTEAIISYFKGQPEEWRTGLPTYSRVVYHDLWPGIDLVYEGVASQLKYTFIVQPGADPSQIQLAYRGVMDVTLNDAGQLEVTTPLGGFTDDTPVAYQEINGERVPVEMAYVLDTAVASSPQPRTHTSKQIPATQTHPFSFHIGDYDPELPLILDPVVLLYAGYIGGTGGGYGVGIAVDEAGNAYVTGYTSSTEATFPVLVGPDLAYNGGTDAYVAKVNSSGSALLYAGYIGGTGADYGADIAVDGAGNAYVTGRTDSTEATFPVLVGPDLTHNGGFDVYVAKVNSSAALVYAGYIGGSDLDYGYGIAVDEAGNAYVTGYTSSTEATFPVLVGPDLTYNGGADAYVAKVNSSAALVYAGYIGGTGSDYGAGIAVDGSGNAYVTGRTMSTEVTFPVLVGPDLTHDGGFDAYVAKVNSSGSALLYAGYIGGTGVDYGIGIAVDGAGNAYATGRTSSTEAAFPVLVGPDLTHNGGGNDAYVAKVNSSGSALLYAGYIGGTSSDYGVGIAVDEAGNAYVTGYTSSTEATFPVLVGPDLTYNGGVDAYVAKVNSSGSALLYAGYIGGTGADYGYGIAVDEVGNAYVTGSTDSTEATFPVLVGPDLTFNGGDTDTFVVKIGLDANVTPPTTVFLPVILNNYPPCFIGPMEQEPNNSRIEANGPLCFGRQYQGRPDDPNDYYFFDMGSPGTITVDLTNHIGQGLQLLLYYGANTSPIAQDIEPPYHIELPNGQDGRYYVRIYSTGGYAQSPLYQLTVNADSAALLTP